MQVHGVVEVKPRNVGEEDGNAVGTAFLNSLAHVGTAEYGDRAESVGQFGGGKGGGPVLVHMVELYVVQVGAQAHGLFEHEWCSASTVEKNVGITRY